ncbi:hypothetical protein NHF46_16565 [Arthrobacter alpinus]|nr:hypothetical protein [Arthrobacter alpinus]
MVSPLREKPQAPDGEVVLARFETEIAEAEAIADEILARKGISRTAVAPKVP